MVDRIDLGLAADAAVEHRAGRLHACRRRRARWRAGRIRARRRRPDAGPCAAKRVDLPRQRMARVRGHRRAVELVHRHQHLAARRAGAVQRLQRAGDRPAAQIAVAGIPDQAGLVDILAGDVEAEDGDRQMPAALVEAHQFVAADDLAAADAVGVGQHDVEGLDLGMGVEKVLRFVDGRAGRGSHDVTLLVRQLVSRRKLCRNIAEGGDQPVDLARAWWPARPASCCGRARSARRG